jgi:hypothetical protein
VPLLVYAVMNYGAIGAALTLGLYGLILYVAYQMYALRGIPNAALFSSMLRDFIIPGAVSFVVVGMAGHWLNGVNGKIAFIGFLTLALVAGWFCALLACRDLFENVEMKLKNLLNRGW